MRRFPAMAIRIVLVGGLLAPVGCSDFLGLGDDGAPTLESTIPAAGATDASVLGDLTLRFSTDLDLASLEEGVRLEAGGRTVAVRRTLTGGRTVVVTPTDPLDFGTEYVVVLAPPLTSTDGHTLQHTSTWSFRTRGLPPPVPDEDTLRRHLTVLAHDTMRGRGSGSADELRAARYLEDRFLAYGLQAPAGGMIQPFQAMSRRGDTLLSSRNVLAQLPGSGGLAHEWLVVGAHYDHIGFRGLVDDSDGPNNGADDNGSGTVTVLELARVLQAYIAQDGMAGTDRRSILFMGFGAEEEGLLGSCHYVDEAPAVPLGETKAMLNFDMVGRLRDVLVVSGQETAPEWPALVANANAPELFLFRPESSSPGGTDHSCFWRAGIPWVGFFTDFHDQYHGPEDDVELINFPGMRDIGALGVRILTRLLVMPEAPGFIGPLPALAEQGPASSKRARLVAPRRGSTTGGLH